MIFHGYFRSSSAHRCRIAFNLKGIEPEMRSHHLRRGGGEQNRPSFLQLNPQGLVPALELTGDGEPSGSEAVLIQSLAIIEWLDETFPDPSLLPDDPVERAQVRAFAQIIACDVHPLQNLRVLQHLRSDFRLDQQELDQWCQHWIGKGLNACETLLERHVSSGRFCFGDSPTLADICLVPQVYSAQRFGVDLSDMPKIRSIFEACEQLPAFEKARPANQPDAEA